MGVGEKITANKTIIDIESTIINKGGQCKYHWAHHIKIQKNKRGFAVKGSLYFYKQKKRGGG